MPKVAGYENSAPEKVPAPGNIDIVFALYRKTGTQEANARVETRVYATEADAKADYATQAQGWKNPPPGLFGPNLNNAAGPTLSGMAEATAYVAQTKDAQGIRVYTDVYRAGRVIVVQHVLSADEPSAGVLRKALADSVKAKVG
ncbi:MAG: hypothetical protein HY875_09650 [Chloroflexi bacterium]|nr:hypothetical protein [Chloroflexota bacterium]